VTSHHLSFELKEGIIIVANLLQHWQKQWVDLHRLASPLL
jgi:hypothetical protein